MPPTPPPPPGAAAAATSNFVLALGMAPGAGRGGDHVRPKSREDARNMHPQSVRKNITYSYIKKEIEDTQHLSHFGWGLSIGKLNTVRRLF